MATPAPVVVEGLNHYFGRGALRRQVLFGVPARGGDAGPGRPVDQRARGIGRSVSPVGPGREQRDSGDALQFGRGSQRQLLASAAVAGRPGIERHRRLPAPDEAVGSAPAGPEERTDPGAGVPGLPREVGGAGQHGVAEFFRPLLHPQHGEAVAGDHVGDDVSKGAVAGFRGIGGVARGLTLQQSPDGGRHFTVGGNALQEPEDLARRTGVGGAGPGADGPGVVPDDVRDAEHGDGAGRECGGEAAGSPSEAPLPDGIHDPDGLAAPQEEFPEGAEILGGDALGWRGGEARRAA